MVDNRPIGLFDSGVGGLSILLEIKKILPRERFIFFADQGHNPYGERTRAELRDFAARISKFLIRHNAKLLVVACNTATCYALDHLRSKFTLPIVGVVPAVKPAIKLSQKSKIAIISTPATAKSTYLKSLIADFAHQSQVLRLGCDGLEEAIEYWQTEDIAKLLDKACQKIEEFGADVVVLGCTHFPFVKDQIRKRLEKRVRVIDSGKSVARRVKFILDEKGKLAIKQSPDTYYTTSDPAVFSKVASTLLKYKVAAQKAII